MTCVIENIFEDGEHAILEWSDPNGLRGCGFFQVREDQIVFQRGYFDQLSFFGSRGFRCRRAISGAESSFGHSSCEVLLYKRLMERFPACQAQGPSLR